MIEVRKLVLKGFAILGEARKTFVFNGLTGEVLDEGPDPVWSKRSVQAPVALRESD